MLRTDDHGRVRLLTLDRPEALNAFNTAMYDTVAEALTETATDGDIAVVVLTGEGRAFSAGQDLGEMADLAGSMRLEYPTAIKVVELPCTGKLDVLYVLRAFEDGADGVLVAG